MGTGKKIDQRNSTANYSYAFDDVVIGATRARADQASQQLNSQCLNDLTPMLHRTWATNNNLMEANAIMQNGLTYNCGAMQTTSAGGWPIDHYSRRNGPSMGRDLPFLMDPPHSSLSLNVFNPFATTGDGLSRSFKGLPNLKALNKSSVQVHRRYLKPVIEFGLVRHILKTHSSSK